MKIGLLSGLILGLCAGFASLVGKKYSLRMTKGLYFGLGLLGLLLLAGLSTLIGFGVKGINDGKTTTGVLLIAAATVCLAGILVFLFKKKGSKQKDSDADKWKNT